MRFHASLHFSSIYAGIHRWMDGLEWNGMSGGMDAWVHAWMDLMTWIAGWMNGCVCLRACTLFACECVCVCMLYAHVQVRVYEYVQGFARVESRCVCVCIGWHGQTDRQADRQTTWRCGFTGCIPEYSPVLV